MVPIVLHAPNRVFGETTAVGVSEARSYYDYNYETEFQIWKENKEFEHQNISMSRPPLDLTPIGNNTPNAKISHLDLTPVGMKTLDPKPQVLPT